jgi:NDP-sugar pyrophosphorylase family protein
MKDLKEIDVAILCGGLGKRLREQTKGGQKTMVTFDEQPFLVILLEYLKKQGFRRVVLCTGHHAEDVEAYFDKLDIGMEIAYSKEESPLGTGGAIKNAKNVILSDPFLVLNGDCFCALDYKAFIDFHFQKKAQATLSLSRLDEKKDFGTIQVGDDGRILSFQEKIESDQSDSVYVNTGIYCFNREAFDWMPGADQFSFETEFFPLIVDKQIYGFKEDKGFIDIGTPDRFKKAQELFRKAE